jgi:protein phosphatase PTC7
VHSDKPAESPPTVAFGVADGVGGWTESGVDPADFAHGLCEYMSHTSLTHPQPSTLSAQRLLQSGFDLLSSPSSTVAAGGSTACIALLTADGKLDLANLGDSGLLHLRLGSVHAATQPQLHAFNTPYQLARIPAAMQKRNAAFGGEQLCDLPKDADVARGSVQAGDVLVVASDGVWDNLDEGAVNRIVSQLMLGAGAWVDGGNGITASPELTHMIRGEEMPVSALNSRAKKDGGDETRLQSLQTFLAIGVTSAAKSASVNTKVDGPFAREVQKWYPEEAWHGGKVDDICVVVCVVVEDK